MCIPHFQAKEKIAAKRIEASLQLVLLKKLNRLEKVRTRAGRDALHKEKQRVDSTHLLLQNLLYEADHLDKEVTKCLQFKSKDEEIELVPLEDFYRDAPAEISRPVSFIVPTCFHFANSQLNYKQRLIIDLFCLF